MYDVLKELMEVNSIVIMKFGEKMEIEDEFPIKGVQTEFLGKTFTYPLQKAYKKAEHYYNNLELTGGKLKTKLQILQDYGDNEGCMGDPALKEIPKFLVFPEFDPSIGWYDGYICYLTPFKGRLCVVKLIEHDPIDLDKIYAKRPYNYKAYFDSNDPEKKVKLEIRISYNHYNPETQKFEGNTEFLEFTTCYTWDMLTNPYYLNKAFYEFYPHTEWSAKQVKDYLTPYFLISMGFSLVNNGLDEEGKSYWKKGKIKIYTNCMDYPNDYYWVGNKNFWSKNVKVIFRKSELMKYIKSLKTDK